MSTLTKGFFITGTDTHVGKTLVASLLLKQLTQEKYKTIGLKPVASGCIKTQQGLRNDDAIQLQQNASLNLPYEIINPYAFKPAIAPHIAAKQQGLSYQHFNVKQLINHYHFVKNHYCPDYLIIEGCGGWKCPLNEEESFSDYAKALQLPIILVVGMQLGCLNHAQMTAQAIQETGLSLQGWVANSLTKTMPYAKSNQDTLSKIFHFPLLGQIPSMTSIKKSSKHLKLSLIR